MKDKQRRNKRHNALIEKVLVYRRCNWNDNVLVQTSGYHNNKMKSPSSLWINKSLSYQWRQRIAIFAETTILINHEKRNPKRLICAIPVWMYNELSDCVHEYYLVLPGSVQGTVGNMTIHTTSSKSQNYPKDNQNALCAVQCYSPQQRGWLGLWLPLLEIKWRECTMYWGHRCYSRWW